MLLLPKPSPPPHLAWTGDVKCELLEYAGKRRFHRAYEQAFLDQFGDYLASMLDEEGNPREPELIDEYGDPLGAGGISPLEFGNFLDAFTLEHRLPDGRTIVDHFVADHPKLTDEQRAHLLSWQDVAEGVFKIERNEGNSLRLHNLVNDLPYHAYANAGAPAIRDMKRGFYLAARLVPLGDDWLLSGYQELLDPANRREIYMVAIAMALGNPQLVFRNPALVERAWEAQHRERTAFIAYFGADMIELPGAELGDKIRAFRHFGVWEWRDETGQTIAEQTGLSAASPDTTTLAPNAAPPDPEFEDDFRHEKSVGVIYDELDGLNYFPGFAPVVELFADPALIVDRRHREALLMYLEDPDYIPLPLVRLAERDLDRTNQLFRTLLKRSHFDWAKDGAGLLQKYKAGYYAEPRFPTSISLPDGLIRGLSE